MDIYVLKKWSFAAPPIMFANGIKMIDIFWHPLHALLSASLFSCASFLELRLTTSGVFE